MAENQREIEELLRQKFPEMTPIKGGPALFLLNGCGTSVYGKRDYDAETRTYIKTLCLCFIFIPVLSLGAYRVADAGANRWYFLGKEPLSAFAKLWNMLVLLSVLGIAGIGGWESYTHSPDYMAGKQMDTANEMAADRQYLKAAQEYAAIASRPSSHAAEAREAARKIFDEHFGEATAEEACGLLAFAAQQEQSNSGLLDKGAALKMGYALSAKHESADPKFALKILDTVAPLAALDKAFPTKREALLKAAAAQHPDDPELASQLAEILESRKELDACVKLLAPVGAKLGKLEGARILGQYYAQQEQYDASYALLAPYCDERMKGLHAAEQELNKMEKQVSDLAISDLKNGVAGDAWYQNYNRLAKDKQQEKVTEFVSQRIRNNAPLKQAQEKLARESNVVPVALELGIVMLRRAQGQPPEERKQTLEAAEKVFLSIQGVASETDEYRIFYGQVLYWLGRYKDGRKLFDEYLASKKDAFISMMSVARMLREVGADAECRELCEKAYAKSAVPEEKAAAAHMRAVTFTDLEDKIKWLGLSSPTENEVKADLFYAKGTKAHLEGKNAEAEKNLRDCLAVYATMPKTSATLNNAALAYYALFPITGLKEDFRQGASMMEEALKLEPGKSILLDNVSQALTGRAVMDVAGDEVDYKVLRISPSLDILGELYSDENGRAAIFGRFFGSPDGKKAVSLLEQTLLLAPKRASIYQELASFYLSARNAAGVKALLEKAKGVEFDSKENIQTLAEFLAGQRDAEIQAEVQVRLAKWEKTLAEMPKDVRGATPALACERYVQAAYEGYPANVPCDPEKIVGLAERALSAKDCSGSRGLLTTALFFRAHQRLCKSVPEFAELDKKLKRNLSFTEIFASGLEKLPKLREAAAADPDVRKAAGLLYASVRAIPLSTTSWDWIMLTHLNPEGARVALENLKQDEARLASYELTLTLNPHSADAALAFSWLLRALGQNERAETVLKDCAKFGFPMP
ncbi:MAG: hypothetical protein HY291_05725 [Planctomycetes bacterium]|nr:hypothetical protein [Planctomycetota bacterium]